MNHFSHRVRATELRNATTRHRRSIIISTFLALLFAMAYGPLVHAQVQCDAKGWTDPCKDANCLTDFIELGTGYDQAAGTTYTPGDKDSYWTIVYDGAHGLTVPRPADVIKEAPIWPVALTNSQWIGAFPGSGVDQYVGDVTYERCFCVCKENKFKFELDILVDDAAIVLLDGTLIGTIPAPGYNTPTHYSFTQSLPPGRHCLEVRVQNITADYAGLDISGTVTGVGLLRDRCCAASVPLEDPCCQTDRVVIPTDETWTITTGPATVGTFPQCATIISNPHQLWTPAFAGTNWIGTNANGTSGPWGGPPDIYVYHKSFCVQQEGTYVITISSMADDAGTIFLNGVALGNTGGFLAPITQTFIVALTPGCNCIDIEVQDIGFAVTGLDALIDIQGGLLLQQKCCDCAQCNANPAPRRQGDGNDGASGVESGGRISEMRPTLVSIPNPATGEATVNYVLNHAADAQLLLFNSAGQRVMTMDQGARSAGQHAVPIVTKGLPAGAYRLQLKYGNHTLTIPLSVQ